MTLIYGQLNWDGGGAFAASAKPQSPEQSPARATIARLRAFSLLLCMDTKIANELVEITLVRASVSTDLSHLNPSHLAWLISRLRSYFYAKYAHRQVPVGPRPPLFAVTWQRHGDLLAALSGLTVEQREALILIEAAGLSYKEGARICHRPFLTFKKFVEQARVDLALGLSSNAAETYVEEVLLKAFRGFVLET